LTTLHEKAIYLHEAKQFHVEKFDYKERKAYVRWVDCDYYTDAIDYTQVKILHEADAGALGEMRAANGSVRVNRQIVGFKKIKFYTLENVGCGRLQMPEQEMHTTSFWVNFPASFLASMKEFTSEEKQNGLHGLGNALRTVASLLLMCDPHDLGVAVTEEPVSSRANWSPNLYLYDSYPGGVGLSEPLYREAARLATETRRMIRACNCDAGCPSCVGPVGEVGERGKEVALRFLDGMSSPVV